MGGASLNSMSPFLSLAIDAVFVVGPVVGYIPQYIEIRSTGNTEVFSTVVCFILLMAHILRVFYWFYKDYAVSLLGQSLLMVVAQLVLLRLIVGLRHKHICKDAGDKPTESAARVFVKKFWQWERFGEYVAFLTGFVLLVSLLLGMDRLVLRTRYFGEAVGIAAMSIEACLGVPQMYLNNKHKQTRGLRWELIASWLIGDLLKTVYFLATGAPWMFAACGLVQILGDAVIVGQMYCYRYNSVGPSGSDSPPQLSTAVSSLVHSSSPAIRARSPAKMGV